MSNKHFAVVGLLTVLLSHGAQATPAVKYIYAFKGGVVTGGRDGSTPNADIIFDSAGNLYTTTYMGGTHAIAYCQYACGTAVKLSPPAVAGGNWTETILHDFGAGFDATNPEAGFIADKAGNLYTATSNGGTAGDGTVVQLSPPTGNHKAWSEKILYNFTGNPGDGSSPRADLVADAAGNLYGTTYEGGIDGIGTIFKLSPPAAGKTKWTETLIHSFIFSDVFSSPTAKLIFDKSGNLYTTLSQGGAKDTGAVVKFAPPAAGKTEWTETVIYAFKGGNDGAYPNAGLIADKAGNFYTTTVNGGLLADVCGTYGCGTVVKISPPGAGRKNWTETVLYRFKGYKDGANPYGGLLADHAGNLFLSTYAGGFEVDCFPQESSPSYGCGALVKLSPPKAGSTAWTDTVLYRLDGGPNPAGRPINAFTADRVGNIYTAIAEGVGPRGAGGIIEISGSGFVRGTPFAQ